MFIFDVFYYTIKISSSMHSLLTINAEDDYLKQVDYRNKNSECTLFLLQALSCSFPFFSTRDLKYNRPEKRNLAPAVLCVHLV